MNIHRYRSKKCFAILSLRTSRAYIYISILCFSDFEFLNIAIRDICQDVTGENDLAYNSMSMIDKQYAKDVTEEIGPCA